MWSFEMNRTHERLSIFVYTCLFTGGWFSPDTPVSSNTKSGRHDIAEILLKVALNTTNQIISKHTCTNSYVLFIFGKVCGLSR
jgi:hypothetical protein